MTNYPPHGQYPPPQQYQPQQQPPHGHWQQGYPPPPHRQNPPKKGIPTWLWIVGGVGLGLPLMAAMVFLGGGNTENNDGKQQATPASSASKQKAVQGDGGKPAWVRPKKGPLVDQLRVTRNKSGGIVISGKSRLPPGTRVWVTIRKVGSKRNLGTAKVFISDSQEFFTEPFTNNNRPHRRGRYEVEVLCIFNGAWQKKEILDLVGRGGRKLPPTALVPSDKEFPDAGGRVEIAQKVMFPPLPPSLIAIEAVKRSKLFVRGKGRSYDNVEGVVKLFLSSKQFKPPYAWKAERKKGTSVWIVTFTYAKKTGEAIPAWSYNARTKRVRYHNHSGKLWSWSPKY